jgi:hypothetical protein
MNILAIDPGKDGFLCRYDGHELQFAPTPTMASGKGTKREYFPTAMLAELLKLPIPSLVVIEKQQAMPPMRGRSQGAASTFSTGYGYGLWHGLIVGARLPMLCVHPRTWQSAMLRDIGGEDTKARAAIAAGRLFPGVDFRATERCRNWHDGKVDAALLAWYGWHTAGPVRYTPVDGRDAAFEALLEATGAVIVDAAPARSEA